MQFADISPYSSYRAMYSAYRQATNSLSIPFASFPRYPPYCTAIRKSYNLNRRSCCQTTNWMSRISRALCWSYGIYIASPTDSTWQGSPRRSNVGGVAQWAQLLMRTLMSWHRRKYPKFTERVRICPLPSCIHVWAPRVTEQLPRLWLVKGQFAGLLLRFSFRP